MNADDLGFKPSRALLATMGLRRRDLMAHDDMISALAAEKAADRSTVIVEAL